MYVAQSPLLSFLPGPLCIELRINRRRAPTASLRISPRGNEERIQRKHSTNGKSPNRSPNDLELFSEIFAFSRHAMIRADPR
jgi:hypothetical protein